MPLVFVSTTFPLLLNGRVLSPRWRALVWAGVIGTASFSLSMAFDP